MTEPRDAWDDVGARFRRLGARLRQATDEAGSGEGDRITDAWKSFVAALDDAASSFSKAVQDPAFRDEAKGAASALGDAVAASINEVGDDLRERFGRGSDGGEGNRS